MKYCINILRWADSLDLAATPLEALSLKVTTPTGEALMTVEARPAGGISSTVGAQAVDTTSNLGLIDALFGLLRDARLVVTSRVETGFALFTAQEFVSGILLLAGDTVIAEMQTVTKTTTGNGNRQVVAHCVVDRTEAVLPASLLFPDHQSSHPQAVFTELLVRGSGGDFVSRSYEDPEIDFSLVFADEPSQVVLVELARHLSPGL